MFVFGPLWFVILVMIYWAYQDRKDQEAFEKYLEEQERKKRNADDTRWK